MAWAFKTLIVFFNHTAQVCTNGRYSPYPLMITVYKQFSFCYVSKGINRKIVYTTDLKVTLVLCQAGDELPEQAYGCKHPRS